MHNLPNIIFAQIHEDGDKILIKILIISVIYNLIEIGFIAEAIPLYIEITATNQLFI